jgi:hypothetical protein
MPVIRRCSCIIRHVNLPIHDVIFREELLEAHVCHCDWERELELHVAVVHAHTNVPVATQQGGYIVATILGIWWLG